MFNSSTISSIHNDFHVDSRSTESETNVKLNQRDCVIALREISLDSSRTNF